MPHPSTRTPIPENLKFTILINTNNSFVIITIYSIFVIYAQNKRIFWRNNAFSLYIYIHDLCDHALAPSPGIRGIFKKNCRRLLGHHYYIVFFPDQCSGVEKKIKTNLLLYTLSFWWGSWNLQFYMSHSLTVTTNKIW